MCSSNVQVELIVQLIQMRCGQNQESSAAKEAVWQMLLAAEVRTGILTDQQGVVATCIPENVP